MRSVVTALVMVLAVVAVIVVGVVLIRTNPDASAASANAVQIHMTSNPFPAAVGNQTMVVSLTNGDGIAIDDATVNLSVVMTMEGMGDGMVPLNGRPGKAQAGQYPFDVIWSMAGEWKALVTATLANGQQVEDHFDLFVYPVPPRPVGGEAVYRSYNDIQAELAEDASREFKIIIPQGTQQMIRTGQGVDMLPTEIRLSLSGQNILYIRNDDIADHTIGPFFVRAGETVRQEFTRPATFIGVCTILHGNEVSIIVE